MSTAKRSWRSLLATGVSIAVLAAALALVWPARFGGAAVFVVVRGESMEPGYHSGDLLYARTSDIETITVGDIAVYERPVNDSTSLVVHRIVAEFDDGTLQFKGDNRTTVDQYQPTPSEVVARPVANLGPLPTQLLIRLPIILALAVAMTVTWALWPRRDELPPDEEHDPQREERHEVPAPTHRRRPVMAGAGGPR